MRVLMIAAGVAALMAGAGQASATVAVDGNLDAAYGPPKSEVLYDPATPESNFGAPGPTTDAQGYSIYETSDASSVYLFLQASGPGAPVGNFSNLYFDLDPQNNNGSDLGFEVSPSHVDAFIPGESGSVDLTNIQVAASNTGTGLEIAIPNTDFENPIAGLAYYDGQTFPTSGSDVTLRLSQSFGYSVAGGASYGPDRLGTVTIGGSAVSAAPEPSIWLLMFAGIGGIGLMLRRANNSLGFRFKDAFSA